MCNGIQKLWITGYVKLNQAASLVLAMNCVYHYAGLSAYPSFAECGHFSGDQLTVLKLTDEIGTKR